MRKTYFIQFFISLLTVGIVIAGAVFAKPNIGGGLTDTVAKGAGYTTGGGQYELSAKIGHVVGMVVALAGTIFLALTVYGGILWLTAAGNPDQVEKAKKILKSSVIGIVLALSAYTITVIVVVAAGGGQGGGNTGLFGKAVDWLGGFLPGQEQ